jgi:hypothetical protein
MAEVLILKFAGVGQADYDAVNGKLGIDTASGEGDWPEGMLMHAAGTAEDGGFVVTEVWSSREAQAAFMDTRLGAALAASGVTAAPEVTWIPLLTYVNLGA